MTTKYEVVSYKEYNRVQDVITGKIKYNYIYDEDIANRLCDTANEIGEWYAQAIWMQKVFMP